jgi:phage host-nuclease inhibitor protein Gam
MDLPTEVRVISSWEDADRAMLALRIVEAQIAQEGARFDQAIQEAQERKSKVMGPLQARKERMEKVLEEFATANRTSLGSKKSINLVHGRIGWRKGNRKLTFTSSEGTTIRMLKLRSHPECIVVKEEIDKAALKNLPPHELALCGIGSEQKERFYYDLSSDPPIVYPDVQPFEEGDDAGTTPEG